MSLGLKTQKAPKDPKNDPIFEDPKEEPFTEDPKVNSFTQDPKGNPINEDSVEYRLNWKPWWKNSIA